MKYSFMNIILLKMYLFLIVVIIYLLYQYSLLDVTKKKKQITYII